MASTRADSLATLRKEFTLKLVIGSDHAGFALKEEVRANLAAAGHEVVDLGAFQYDPEDDYPDFAVKVGEAIKAGSPRAGFSSAAAAWACAWRRTRFPEFAPGFATIPTPRTRAWSTTI